ncbi:MAG: phenylphosphate carboxylase subunit gamma [Desulfobacterales bacterium]|nr:phenylphosphate carboxylase subunit gamma [Desulfobacterales bacterium]
MKEYDTFVLKDEMLPDGKECRLTIRDLTSGKHKYSPTLVKALVSSSSELLPEGDNLWIRTELGHVINKEPWKIKIIESLDSAPPRVC